MLPKRLGQQPRDDGKILVVRCGQLAAIHFCRRLIESRLPFSPLRPVPLQFTCEWWNDRVPMQFKREASLVTNPIVAEFGKVSYPLDTPGFRAVSGRSSHKSEGMVNLIWLAPTGNAVKDFSSRKNGVSDSDVPLFGRLRPSSAWGVFDVRCEGTASPKDSEAVARQRFSQKGIIHGVAQRAIVRHNTKPMANEACIFPRTEPH